MNTQNISKRGFTLLELLIVISIIAILSVILIVALNPAETLRKARDTQRISDMASMKTAIGIYTTTKSSPLLDGVDNDDCQSTAGAYEAGEKIWYSEPSGNDISDADLDGDASAEPTQVAESALGNIDGTGWIPVPLDDITGGSPISNLPIDPINDIAAGGSALGVITNEGLGYRYVCYATDLTFEINAILESAAFGPTSTDDDKSNKDGGDNSNYYEVGTNLLLLGAGANF